MAPKVSIIIPVYNTLPYLGECLDSLTAQTMVDWECIAVDDGSTDGSGALLDARAAAEPRLRVLHGPNLGPGAARNKALELASGEWVVMLDSDDSWAPELLEKVLDYADGQGVGMAHFGIAEFRDGARCGEQLPLREAGLRVVESNRRYLGRATPYLCDKIIKRELLARHGIRFNPEMRYSEDLPLLVQYCAAVDRVALIGEPLYLLRYHGASATAQFRTGALPVSSYLNMLEGVTEGARRLFAMDGVPRARVRSLYISLWSWLRARIREIRNSIAGLAPDQISQIERAAVATKRELLSLAPWGCKLSALRQYWRTHIGFTR